MIAPLVISLLLQVAPPPQTLSVDLDGDGSVETVTAKSHGHKIRIEVANAAGKTVAHAEASSPGSDSVEISLTSGSLGASGALLAVSASAPASRCRTVWRLRGSELDSVPLVGAKGRLPDCAPLEGWTERWEKTREDSPSDYIRERTRSTPNGEHRQTEVYRFAGFDLRLNPERSTAEIAGIPIPDWSPALYYPKPLVESLFSAFNLSAFKKTPRLSFVTDRDAGIFALEVERPGGAERLAVTAAQRGSDKGVWKITVGSAAKPLSLEVHFGTDPRNPIEVTADGMDNPFGRVYIPATHLMAAGLEVFATAEDAVALRFLQGSWDNSRGERMVVNCLSLTPAVVELNKKRATVSIDRSPEGTDVVLLPPGGSAPTIALALHGPNALVRFPVSCSAGSADSKTCRVTGRGVGFHRVGAQMNAR